MIWFLKAIGMVCLIGSGAAGGLYFAGKLRARAEQLQKGKYAVEFLKAQIRYEREPLPDALAETGKTCRGEIPAAMATISACLREYTGEPAGEVWRRVGEDMLAKSAFSTDDVEQFCLLGEQLGIADVELQESILDRYLLHVDREIGVLNGEIREKAKLYRNLGILLGVFVTILLL